MRQQELLDVADSIGHNIAQAAQWDGSVCRWNVDTPDPAHQGPRRSRTAARGDVYQGSAGIAWFLAELYAVTGHPILANTAEGGIRHALSAAKGWPTNHFSFYRGRVGVAFVANRLARLLAQPRLAVATRELLEPLVGQERHDNGLDVINGAAGAIPALLELHYEFEDETLLEMACGLGERLFEKAQREPVGWSWDTVGPSVARHLTGLAHGASGIGLALLELFRATGHGAYRFAAEMAFLYERRWFDADTANWPDFRHPELSDLVFYHPADSQPSQAAPGSITPWRPSFANAWCHGAPGIGLARARAFELTSQPLYQREAEAAVASVLASLNRPNSDLSLCHGLGGNCELLLYLGEVSGDPATRAKCAEHAERVRDHLPQADRTNPGLMLGEAGIGAFFLRLASASTPSFLVRRPSLQGHIAPLEDKGFADLAALAAQEYFGKTLRSFDALGMWPIEVPTRRNDNAPLSQSPVAATYHKLRRFVGKQRGRRREMMLDAFRRERTAYEMAREPSDFAEESLHRLNRLPAEDVPWDDVLLSWSDGTELITNHWDWDPWLVWGAEGEPTAETVFSMLFRQHNRVSIRPIGPFAAAVLSGLATPASLHELTRRVTEIFSGPERLEQIQLQSKVLSQARELYGAGLIEIAESVNEQRASVG